LVGSFLIELRSRQLLPRNLAIVIRMIDHKPFRERLTIDQDLAGDRTEGITAAPGKQ
jgi:hypothetical protein